jgi:hypothetical protein
MLYADCLAPSRLSLQQTGGHSLTNPMKEEGTSGSNNTGEAVASPVCITLAACLFYRREHLPDCRRLELFKRLGFDLPDPLARHEQLLADLLERERFVLPDAEPHSDHELFARR